MTPATIPNQPFDTLKDISGITMLANIPNVLVMRAGGRINSVKDLVSTAKSKPGSLNYASAGQGSSLHLTGEIFKMATGTDLVHVAYKGSAPALTDLIAGQVQLMFGTMPATLPQAKSGKLRALGVSSLKRATAAPEVPTIAEGGVAGFEVLNWYGITLPGGTSQAIVRALNQDLLKALATPAMIEAFNAQGNEEIGRAHV